MRKTTGSTAMKAGAFILLTLSVITGILCVIGALIMWSAGVYSRTQENLKRYAYSDILFPLARDAAYRTYSGNIPAAMDKGNNVNAEFSVTDSTGALLWQNDGFAHVNGMKLGFAFTYDDETGLTFVGEYGSDAERVWVSSESEPHQELIYVDVAVNEAFPVSDELSFASRLIDTAYHFRYSVYIIGVLAAVTVVICFIFLMCAAGHRRGTDKVTAGWGTFVPFDLLTAAFVSLCLVCAIILDSVRYIDFEIIVSLCVMAVLLIPLFTGWCMSVALRIKLGTLWKNTVVYRTYSLVRRGVTALFRSLPLVWGVVLAVGAVTLAELAGIILCAMWGSAVGTVLFMWFCEKLVLIPAAIGAAMQLRKLEKGGKALAEGDLSYKTDTVNMLPYLKKHGENLNSIAAGMSAAVEERMKSERLKTELITNVSHDIKTPLTSIINYADLISREESGNEKIHEYTQVLLRHSARLKRLITDLIDASKASTGNVDVNAVPMDACVFLSQAEGEYRPRLSESGLELVLKKPEEPVTVTADGQLLWRIFDNLLSNVCKYAQSGTRVYLSLERSADKATICLKNISAYPLELTPEELTERFTRGDSSRHTEGSGLGLSIARSLTELQKGEFAIDTDGDLFKVTLSLPMI